MKKLLVIIFILLFSATTSSYAITTTPTPLKKVTPTGTPEVTKEQEDIDRIEKIKDLVASKVAELKLVEKRGILTASAAPAPRPGTPRRGARARAPSGGPAPA